MSELTLIPEELSPREEKKEAHAPQILESHPRIAIVGSAQSTGGDGWLRLVQAKTPLETFELIPIPYPAFNGDGREAANIISGQAGIFVEDFKKLAEELRKSHPRVCTITSKSGWVGVNYVLSDKSYGYDDVIHRHPAPPSQSGILEEWREKVARYCVGNSRLVFGVSAAFAGPLLHLVDEQSGGFHFTGASSEGKTIILRVAGSVWGGPEYFNSWRITDNALEVVAEQQNDGLLSLDDIGQAPPERVGEINYMLGNGVGKGRMKEDSTLRHIKTWRTMVLSTGETTPEEIARELNKKHYAGQEVRLTSLKAYAGAGGSMGVFESIHGAENSGVFAEMLKGNSKQFYGAPIRAFLPYLTELGWYDAERHSILVGKEPLAPYLKAWVDSVRQEFSQGQTAGEIVRVARRFSTVAVAGDMATLLGITGWPTGAATRAARHLFNEWVSQRAGKKEDLLEVVTGYVQRFRDSPRFVKFGTTDARQSFNGTAGYIVEKPTGSLKHEGFLFITSVFQDEVCKGLDPQNVLKALSDKGHLETTKNEGFRFVKKVDGKNEKFYYVKATIFEGCPGSDSYNPSDDDIPDS